MNLINAFYNEECTVNCIGCASCVHEVLDSTQNGEYVDLMIRGHDYSVYVQHDMYKLSNQYMSMSAVLLHIAHDLCATDLHNMTCDYATYIELNHTRITITRHYNGLYTIATSDDMYENRTLDVAVTLILSYAA